MALVAKVPSGGCEIDLMLLVESDMLLTIEVEDWPGPVCLGLRQHGHRQTRGLGHPPSQRGFFKYQRVSGGEINIHVS